MKSQVFYFQTDVVSLISTYCDTDKSPLTPATRPDQNMNNSYDVFRIMQNVAGLLGTFHSAINLGVCFTIVSFQKEE